MSVQVIETTYKGFGKCVELSNGSIILSITVDQGPRVIRLAVPGGENMFCENPDYVGINGWKMLGGHRLWHSPEHAPRTYERDDKPVRWEEIPGGVHLFQEIEQSTGIEKEMEIILDEEYPLVSVTHRMRNTTLWPIELALWGISVMSPGGKEVVPMSQRDTGLLGNRKIALWPYSHMNDHRVWWGSRYITLQQDPKMQPAFKFGIDNEYGWAAYFNHDCVFIKQHMHDPDEKYPDGGMSYETYTTDFMLEMESLSPVQEILPGEDAEHVEIWSLISDVQAPENDDDAIDAVMDTIIDTSGCGGCGGCEDCGGCGDEDCEECGHDHAHHHHHH